MGLGIEFFDAVDVALAQIVQLPKAGAPVKRLPPDLPSGGRPSSGFPSTSSTSSWTQRSASWLSRTTDATGVLARSHVKTIERLFGGLVLAGTNQAARENSASGQSAGANRCTCFVPARGHSMRSPESIRRVLL